MTINIKGTGMDLTDAIKGYATDKVTSVEKLTGTESENITCQIELEVTKSQDKGDVYRAEVNIDAAGKFTRAEATAADLYAAIDAVKDELSRQLSEAADRESTLEREGAREAKEMLRGD